MFVVIHHHRLPRRLPRRIPRRHRHHHHHHHHRRRHHHHHHRRRRHQHRRRRRHRCRTGESNLRPSAYQLSRVPYHQAKPAHWGVEPASFRFTSRAPHHQAKPAHWGVEPASFWFTSRAPYPTRPRRLTGESNLRPSGSPAERLTTRPSLHHGKWGDQLVLKPHRPRRDVAQGVRKWVGGGGRGVGGVGGAGLGLASATLRAAL